MSGEDKLDSGAGAENAERLCALAARLQGVERSAFLDRSCGSDKSLRARVELLLLHLQRAGPDMRLMDPLNSADTVIDSDSGKPPLVPVLPEGGEGSMIGRYRLLEKLGEGGFGSVWLAEQREPVRRKVALKIIKLGMDTAQVVARFEVERQALAMMEHPNIARVLDAGATEIGRPFFVMELVRGIPMTRFCDENRMSTKDRLELFANVCGAIQHAHQKGIIHRDIKPSNVLVTLHDGVPVPKVIDFGIAKATQGDLTDNVIHTQFQQFIGTPAYMSPEQAEMSGLDVDTRSDIYSLGVLLYELITGKTPFDGRELVASGIDAMRRTIREKEPVRPSTRLETLEGEERSPTSQRRGEELSSVITLLRGDLDWIVMKCLEKDRTRRYETANGLAQDIRRFLRDELVTARPPSRTYRFQKFVRRNRVLFGAGLAVGLALVAGLTASTLLYIRESAARQLAEQARLEANVAAEKSRQVATFLKEMLQGVGPSVAQGRDTALLREILENTSRRIGKDLKNQPDIQSELLTMIGLTYGDLGEHVRAEQFHREALALRRAYFGNSHPLIAASLAGIGREQRQRGAYVEAEKTLREAVDMNLKLKMTESRESADALNNLAILLHLRGQSEEARGRQEEAVAIYRKLYGETEPRLADMLNDLGGILYQDGQGDLAAAERMFRDGLKIRRNLSGDLHPQNSLMLHNLGRIFRARGDLAQSESSFREALVSLRKNFGDNHPRTAITLHELGLTLQGRGDSAGAEKSLQQALEVYRQKLGTNHAYAAEALVDLGKLRRSQKQFQEALIVFKEALGIRRQALGTNHVEVASVLMETAGVSAELGSDSEASLQLNEALEIYRSQRARQHTDRAGAFTAASAILIRIRQWQRAEEVLIEALPVTPGENAKEISSHRDIVRSLAALYEAWEKVQPGSGRLEKAAEFRRRESELENLLKK